MKVRIAGAPFHSKEGGVTFIRLTVSFNFWNKFGPAFMQLKKGRGECLYIVVFSMFLLVFGASKGVQNMRTWLFQLSKEWIHLIPKDQVGLVQLFQPVRSDSKNRCLNALKCSRSVPLP